MLLGVQGLVIEPLDSGLENAKTGMQGGCELAGDSRSIYALHTALRLRLYHDCTLQACTLNAFKVTQLARSGSACCARDQFQSLAASHALNARRSEQAQEAWERIT